LYNREYQRPDMLENCAIQSDDGTEVNRFLPKREEDPRLKGLPGPGRLKASSGARANPAGATRRYPISRDRSVSGGNRGGTAGAFPSLGRGGFLFGDTGRRDGMKASEIRRKFLDFFAEKGHRVEPSASLVPVDDPSLLWINSGVATLKKYFDGRLKPEKSAHRQRPKVDSDQRH